MRRWSYAELNRKANQLANAFLGFGLAAAPERPVVWPELPRGGAHGPCRAQERHHLGADELPPVSRGGGLRHRQLGRPPDLDRRRVRRALPLDPQADAEGARDRGVRRRGAQGNDRGGGLAARRVRSRAGAAAVRGAHDDLHLGNDRQAEGRGAHRAGEPGAARGAARARRLQAGRHLPDHGSALPLGTGRLHGHRVPARQHHGHPAQVRPRGLAPRARRSTASPARSRRRRRSGAS